MLPYKVLLVCLVAGLGLARAEEAKVVPAQFDEVKVPAEKLAFRVEVNDLQPDVSRFVVSYEAFLSDANGGRFALVTLSKASSNSFQVHRKDFVGTLVNGKRIHPVSIEGETRIEEMGTVLLDFGVQRFPLLKVETRN